jgi:glycosyltransferase involved in cell wall biosynthesis
MKSLHVGNLANVAYGCCKILRQYSHEVTLLTHDERHLMSQPEWDDLELRSEDFLDEFDFDFNRADFGAYRRPDWFKSDAVEPRIDLFDGAARVLGPLVPTGWRRRIRPTAIRTKRLAMRTARAVIPKPIKEWMRHPYFAAMRLAVSAIHGPKPQPATTAAALDQLARLSTRAGPAQSIDTEGLGEYRPHATWLAQYLPGYDVCVAYVLAPIYAMLAGTIPYVSVEIGTMRDIPFDQTVVGRAMALAYRQSDFVLITNPDVIASARRLGLERYAFCPHPVDEDVYAPQPAGSPLRQELLARYRADHLLFAPARQNWEVKGNDRYLRGFARVLANHPRTTLIIPGWGQEVERSQRLCRELGIADRVAWIKPMSERALVKYYQAVDVVLDQFTLNTFGLVTGKALSCECAVVTSYDPGIHDWCFAEHPPLIAASTAEEIGAAIDGLLSDPERRRAIGAESRRWVLAHHSKAIVRSTMERAMGTAVEHFRRKTGVTTNGRVAA